MFSSRFLHVIRLIILNGNNNKGVADSGPLKVGKVNSEMAFITAY